MPARSPIDMSSVGATYCSIINWSINTKSSIDLRTNSRLKFLCFPNPETERERFTFTISHNGSMLVTVTPCASEIKWSLYFKPQHKKGYAWIVQQSPRTPKLQELSHYITESRQTFYQTRTQPGVYILGVTSLYNDSYVKTFVTTSPALSSRYPDVPSNNRVQVTAVKRSLSLSWASGAAVNQPRRSVEYCITISQLKNFQSHCAALAYVHGDKKPTFPDWGFANQRQRSRDLRRKAKPIRKAPAKMIFHQCVGNKTSFTFAKLRRGKRYFADVFIIDKDTNAASAYQGASVLIKKRKRKPNLKIKVGETKTVNLRQKKAVEFKITHSISRLAVELVPCAGKIPFELFYNGKKIKRRTLARRWSSHVITNAKPGTYLLTFPGKRRKKSYVTVYLKTSKPKKSKPVLPKKTNIFIFDKLTTCSKVTLAWMGATIDQNYCLYKTKLRKNGRDSKRHRCLSPRERAESDREFCTSHSAQDYKKQTMARNVTGLLPATWYRFDVFVSRDQTGAALAYKSIKVKTHSRCDG